MRFTSPPFASPVSRVGIRSLLTGMTGCDNAVGLVAIPFARVRRGVHSGYPRRLFALVVEHCVVHVSGVLTRGRNYRTVIAKRDMNRITDRALATVVSASDISHLPILHPLMNVSGGRVIIVSEGVSAFSVSVEPFRSYYAMFAPGRPHLRPGPRRVRGTRLSLSDSTLVDHTIRNMGRRLVAFWEGGL